ncbi:unnamed protein product [Rotaria sordida]|uniref:G-protein coupled receptors family 1 profile domain-containing protein n=3 Tax=Rotaria sordida TaxID=392033 RepID=A0A819JTK0_9BILA|nr:unnamed protein product [Rotaria sordida]CAF3938240.1 unnamed protein product [Rotaria sordida]
MSEVRLNFIGVNWAIVLLVYALDHPDPIGSSLILCRIRGYIIHTCSMCFRYTLMFLCADRYALCNFHVNIRALSRPQIAYRSIGFITIFWIIISVHLLIWESIENGRCGVYGIYGQIFGFYVLIFTGIIPISVMIIFGILLTKALRQVRSRIQPLNGYNRLNARDMKLIKLVLTEVIIYILCTLTYPLMTIYMTVTNSTTLNKTIQRKQIESFINFITMSLLLYLNYNTTFYVHFLTSKAYRNEVKQFLFKLIRKSNELPQNQQIGMTMTKKVLTLQQVRITNTTI